ncbi:transcriptional regulator [Corallococcus sp. AS-1-6]|uniref:transcriptional regulator n=1 Tax=Corallococcus TaxID=83461 RepID=UPI001CBDD470|nr:transcriptional regulator [Corallococcus sp. AS-1-6]MBZ4376710.1 transcriptional regulator [Corallococcus sp. AS-1-6]
MRSGVSEALEAMLEAMGEPRASRLRVAPGVREAVSRALEEAASLGGAAPEPLDFARHLGEHLAKAEDPPLALERLHARDLALALACTQGLPGADARFEVEVLQRMRVPLSRIHPSPAFADEVLQTLRANLLMPRADAPPRLRGYAGVGSLAQWVNMVGVRLALRLRKAQGDASRVEAEVLAAHPAPGGLELSFIREDARAHVRAAFVKAVASLDDEDRELLRLHYVERLSLEKMGALYDLHKSTLSRRLGGVQETLEKRTRRLLSERLALRDAELESLVRTIHGGLDLSLSGLLGGRG